MTTISLKPIDVGFDPRAHDMAVDLSDLDIDGVDYTIGTAPNEQSHHVHGSKTRIAGQLADAGFTCIIVERTPNGREIRYEAGDRKFHVQPHNDNYWIAVDSIDAARDAFHHPEKYR